jgi:hypothetical protein
MLVDIYKVEMSLIISTDFNMYTELNNPKFTKEFLSVCLRRIIEKTFVQLVILRDFVVLEIALERIRAFLVRSIRIDNFEE